MAALLSSVIGPELVWGEDVRCRTRAGWRGGGACLITCKRWGALLVRVLSLSPRWFAPLPLPLAKMSESAWVLRCRGPQGAPATLDLPQGGATTVAEIAELAGKALRVARSRRAPPCSAFPTGWLVHPRRAAFLPRASRSRGLSASGRVCGSS